MPGVAQRVGRVTALLFHDRGTRRGCEVGSAPRPHFTPGKEPVPILQDAGWAPGSVCSSVAIPTELPCPHYYPVYNTKFHKSSKDPIFRRALIFLHLHNRNDYYQENKKHLGNAARHSHLSRYMSLSNFHWL